MDIEKKPTSPHIQIYRWNVSSLTSIMHRMTGIALYFSVVFICWYIVYYAYQINTGYEKDCDCLHSEIFKFIFFSAIFAITLSLYYHFLNGIRHLLWDIGKGFDLKTAKRNGYLVIVLSIILTILTIVASLYLRYY